MDWWKNRLWEVIFETLNTLAALPYPGELVEEVQQSHSYRFSGRMRSETGGQIQLTISGRGILEIDGKAHSLTPGTAFLHNHQDPRICYRYPDDESRPWRFLWLSIYNADSMIEEINKSYGYIFHQNLDSSRVKSLLEYRHYRNSVCQLAPLRGAAMVVELLEALTSPIDSMRIARPHRQLVYQAQEFIMSNRCEKLRAGDIADELKVSREHLSRVFRQETGMTVHDYIMRRKLDLADDLLMQSRLSCKEIAEKLGFDDPAVFVRAYRRERGVTPGAMRSLQE